MYRKHLKCFERFHINFLLRILGMKWLHRFPHTEIRRRAAVELLEAITVRRQFKWASHVRRMQGSRLPSRIFYGQMAEGRRTFGSQKRYKDLAASNMRKCYMNTADFERLSESHDP